jgi:hypothetical protein
LQVLEVDGRQILFELIAPSARESEICNTGPTTSPMRHDVVEGRGALAHAEHTIAVEASRSVSLNEREDLGSPQSPVFGRYRGE